MSATSKTRAELITELRNANRRRTALEKILNPLMWQRAELRAIYEHAPVLLCTLDKNCHVLYANRAFCKFTGIPEKELLGGRACGVFGCINALDDPRGCGFSKQCSTCELRFAIEDSFKTGRAHRNVEYRAALDRKGVKRQIILLGSTVRVFAGGKSRLLLCLQDITEKNLMEQSIRDFSRKLLVVREEERRLLSSVLHHEVGSSAVSVTSRLHAAEEDIRNGNNRKALAALKECGELFAQATKRLKIVAVDLRPPDLDLLGLSAALREYSKRICRDNSLRIRFVDTTGATPISPEVQTCLFRACLECLNNVIRHAEARSVQVNLSVARNQLRLSVSDDGRGFDVDRWLARPGRHLGLQAIREMATAIGGTLDVVSKRGAGAKIVVKIPGTVKR
jgi:signal transduction histidine kinase